MIYNFTKYIFITSRVIKYFFNGEVSYVHKIYKVISSLIKNNGYQYMIKYMKTSRLHITRYMCGKPLFINDANVSVGKDGFPSRLSFLKPLVNDVNGKRILLTLMTLTRGIQPSKEDNKKIKPKFDSIDAPFSGNPNFKIPKEFIKLFVDTYKLRKPKPTYTTEKHYISTKGGPSGKSTWASQWSLYGHSNSTLMNMAYLLQDGFKTLVYDPYMKNMHMSYDKYENIEGKVVCTTNPNKPFNIGKLSIVEDPECKRRVIAMVDYHSQLTLRSIHDDLLDNLSKIPNDRTYTQDPFHSWSDNNQWFYSLDLTSATDRFPLSIQKDLISEIYGDSSFGENWAQLLVNRDFFNKTENRYQRYSVGQPMGAYSSWGAFSLTHHMIVAYASWIKDGNPIFNDYILLGDDIVIKDWRISEIYKGIIHKVGVECSQAKTHVSKDTYEFAKRWIFRGIEVSGVPMRGILSNINNLRITYNDILNYNMRVPNIGLLPCIQLFSRIYTGLETSKNRWLTYNGVYSRMYDFDKGLRYSLQLITPHEIYEYIVNMKNDIVHESQIPSERLILDFTQGILMNGILSEFHQTLNKLNNSFNYFDNLPKESKVTVSYSGLIYGMINKVSRMVNVAQTTLNSSNMNILELIKEFEITDSDSLSRKDRDCNIRLQNLESFWKKSFNKHFSQQRFPDSFYRVLGDGSKSLLYGLDTFDTSSDNIKLNSPWNATFERKALNTEETMKYYLEKNL